MGRILDSWLERNSGYLASLAPTLRPRVQPTAPMQAPDPGFAPAVPGQGSFAPVAAPSSFQLQPAQISPQPPPPTQGPSPAMAKGSGKKYGVKHLIDDMSDDELNAASDQLTSATGKTPEQAYKDITGNAPHKDMSKRELSQFLMEFGLGLLSQPAGLSDPEAFGRAGTAAHVAQQSRQAAAQEQARKDEQTIYDRGQAERKYRDERLDKAFDRDIKLQELDAKELEAISKFGHNPNGKFNHYVGEDGYMYSYDEETGQGVRVEVGGKPVKPDPRVSASGERKLDFEVKYNMYMDTYGARPDGTKLAGADLQRVQKQALEFANRTKEYTDEEAQREAVKGAIELLKNDTNYLMADNAGKASMRSAQVTELKNLYKPPKPADATPDASRLAKGMATPVTNEKGETSYWTLGEDGKPRKVDPSELH